MRFDDVVADVRGQTLVAAGGGEVGQLLDRGAVVGHRRYHPSSRDEGERADRAPPVAPTIRERGQHEQELRDVEVEQFEQAHRLDDVDAGVDEQHAVDGERARGPRPA